MVNQSANLVLHYNGEPGAIDARTLGTSLIGFTRIVEGVNEGLYTGKRIQVEASATGSGSFIVGIRLIESLLETGANLLTDQKSSTLKAIVEATALSVTLRTIFRSSKPKQLNERDGKVIIERVKGNVIIVERPVFDAATMPREVIAGLDQFFGAIEADDHIKDVKLLDENRNVLFEVDREGLFTEFMAQETEISEKIKEQQALVTVVKQSFDPNLKWEIVLDGHRVQALVTDALFNAKIRDRELYVLNGDELNAKIRIRQQRDEMTGAFLDKDYEITEVVSKNPPTFPVQHTTDGIAVKIDHVSRKKRKKRKRNA